MDCNMSHQMAGLRSRASFPENISCYGLPSDSRERFLPTDQSIFPLKNLRRTSDRLPSLFVFACGLDRGLKKDPRTGRSTMLQVFLMRPISQTIPTNASLEIAILSFIFWGLYWLHIDVKRSSHRHPGQSVIITPAPLIAFKPGLCSNESFL